MGFDLDKIKVIAVDVDGTLTNGEYIVDENGILSKSFYTRDFYALNKMRELGYEVIIITSAKDKVIEMKCLPFDFLVYTGIEDKAFELLRILEKDERSWENLGYIGDSENDVGVMELAEWTACPLDSIPEVADNVNYHSVNNGGHGAVYDSLRKFCEYCGIDWK